VGDKRPRAVTRTKQGGSASFYGARVGRGRGYQISASAANKVAGGIDRRGAVDNRPTCNGAVHHLRDVVRTRSRRTELLALTASKTISALLPQSIWPCCLYQLVGIDCAARRIRLRTPV
jgi:hypothetical protein